MRFWDSSALAPAVVEEKRSGRIRDLGSEDEERVVWSLSEVEITSALWRQRRANHLTEDARDAAQRQIDIVLANAVIVTDLSAVVHRARRLLATHNLRAADAMQLGAALLACADDPARLPFVTLDDRLAEAARREGFTVFP